MKSLAGEKNFIKAYLEKLTVEIGERHVGSDGNKKAVDYFHDIVSNFDYDVQKDEFDCIKWEYGEVCLMAGEKQYPALISPYSLSCDIEAELVVVSTLHELELADLYGKILMISGELTKEQIMPKNFVFYNPDEHKKIISVLEDKEPSVIICVTECGQGTSGGQYPFPVFEDGDFNIPSIYMKDIDGKKLMKYHGKKIKLAFDSKRIPTKGHNVIARNKGEGKGRLVLCAHIDTKENTPGALDNATGVAVLLGLANKLRAYKCHYDIEIIAFNGEDYYSVPGQMLYMNQNSDNLGDIKLVINIDGAGHRDSKSAISFYNLEDDDIDKVMSSIENYSTIIRGDVWYEGDHSMFLQQGVPCVAVTSSNVREAVMSISHTPKDTINNVDDSLLNELILGLTDIISNYL